MSNAADEKMRPDDRTVRREQHEKDLRWLMGDPRGRRLMMRLLTDVGMFRCTFDAGCKDIAAEMLFREGQKNVGYRLMSEINAVCPQSYFEMLKEHNDGRQLRDAADSNSDAPGRTLCNPA